jgi:hypothetical protein
MGSRPAAVFKPEYCDMLIAHMREGYSHYSFGAIVGVGNSTIEKWVRKHKEFKKAKEIGHTLALKWWETLYRNASAGITTMIVNGKIQKIRPLAPLIIFAFKNRFGWSDRVLIESDEALYPEP